MTIRRWLSIRREKLATWMITDHREARFYLQGSTALAMCCLFAMEWGDIDIWKELREVFSASIGFGGTIIGFSLAAKSVMLTLPHTRERDEFDRRSGFRSAAQPVKTTAIATGIWSIVGTLLLAFVLPSGEHYLRVLFSCWVGLLFWSAFSVARLVLLLFSMLESLQVRPQVADLERDARPAAVGGDQDLGLVSGGDSTTVPLDVLDSEAPESGTTAGREDEFL